MIRLTGGVHRGRAIKTPPHLKTRPTLSKVRSALFNSLQSQVPGAVVLDLFSGSGALGLEALSRGAERVVFLESHPPTQRLILENAKSLGLGAQVDLCRPAQVESWLESKRLPPYAPFDLILADPPYQEGWDQRLLQSSVWPHWLSPGGLLVLETSVPRKNSPQTAIPSPSSCLVKVKEKIYGETLLCSYEIKSDSQEQDRA